MNAKPYIIAAALVLQLSPLFCFPGNDSRKDSLFREIEEISEDSSLINIHLKLGDEAENDSLQLHYYFEALELSKKANLPAFTGKSYHKIGRYYRFKGNYLQLRKYFFKAAKYYQQAGKDLEIGFLYNDIGITYKFEGNYKKALEYYLKALDIYNANNYSKHLGGVYNNLGIVFAKLNNYDESLEHYRLSAKQRIMNNDSVGLAGVYNNIGHLYYFTGIKTEPGSEQRKQNFDTALTYYKKAVNLHKRHTDDKNRIARGYSSLGAVYAAKSQYDKAMDYHSRALDIYLNSNADHAIVNAYNNIGGIFLSKGNYDEAIYHFNKALECSEKFNLPGPLSQVYKFLYHTYDSLNNHQKSLEYIRKYSTLKDSLLQLKSEKQLAEMQVKYESEKKSREIKMLHAEKAIEEQQLNRNQIIITSASVFLGIVLIFSFFIYRGYHQNKQINTQLSEKHSKISEQKNVIEEKNKNITDSIRYAQGIQNAILPPPEKVNRLLDKNFILYIPKDIVAGDFYWLEQKGDHLLLAAADCTGHGVPGALVSVVCHNALNRALHEFGLTQPAAILDKVRELVEATFVKNESEVKDGMDIALCSYCPDTKELQYAGANNSLWLIRKEGSEKGLPDSIKATKEGILELKADKQPIGKYAKANPFTNHHMQLKDGDTFYLFSDGYADQFGGDKGKKFKYRRLRNTLTDISSLSLPDQKKQLEKAFYEWKGNLEQIDDVCIVGVSV